ncbi:hypothetical protein [Streptomyces sp. NBC_01294]|uniref:hypothetical protein n=1 Tax=Streptomyces sp. NBC_01294 TaxID=2903815 RepID=UPI002DDC6678|nr:hypothetical protein [Streptomyces sp. NBC_01294]WRZ55380.1 hypothetical protein OG534_02090 [Streptomyces sp. NBC_01294]WRZ61316.1 hypothetical protein OG534_35410 [Streptomyces sp. NBC_01294]
MSRSAASGGQLDELAAFALEHVCDAPAERGNAGIGAVFLFADDIDDRYLYTFADLAEARAHLADPTHGYLRCTVAWRPAPDVFAVQAQEIGSATSFLLTRRRVADGPADEVVRTDGARALLPPSGPMAKVTTEAQATTESEAADPAELEELEELEYGFERAVDSGEVLAEADDRLRRWVGRAGESDLVTAEKWLLSRFPHVQEHDPADDVLPEEAAGGTWVPGRYVITFRADAAPTGPVAALATWDGVARQAREVLGPTAAAAAEADGTAVVHPVSGVRLAWDRTSDRYEVSAPLPRDSVPALTALEQLVQLALTVQLETGRRAVDPQLGLYVDRLGGTTWPRRFRLFSRAVRAFRPGLT